MAATLVREPFHRDGWIYEEKIDGWRILAYKDGARVRLVSRNGRDHTRRFAGIAAAIAKLSARSLAVRDIPSCGTLAPPSRPKIVANCEPRMPGSAPQDYKRATTRLAR